MTEGALDDDIVRMANQIARQFPYLSPAEAAEKVAYHLHAFWEPRMIEDFHELAAEHPKDFDDVALAAERILAERYAVAR